METSLLQNKTVSKEGEARHRYRHMKSSSVQPRAEATICNGKQRFDKNSILQDTIL
jgi:hypothetical protein